MTEIITFGNNKGGVGKTSITKIVAYILSEFKNKKVLTIDLDGQENLSSGLAKSFNQELNNEKNLFEGLFGNNNVEEVEDYIEILTDKLHLLTGSVNMSDFERELEQYEEEYHRDLLKYFLQPIMKNYDFILIDTSPFINIVTDNVINISDWVVIPTQTAADALDGTEKFYNYLLEIKDKENYNFKFLGVLSYLVGESATNKKYVKKYIEIFEEDAFDNIIKKSNVVERWADSGITTYKPYDKKTMVMYQKVVDELINRIERRSRE